MVIIPPATSTASSLYTRNNMLSPPSQLELNPLDIDEEEHKLTVSSNFIQGAQYAIDVLNLDEEKSPTVGIEWINRADVCRCCLVECGILDLTGSYITNEGEREVLFDVLKECFDISLNVSEWERSRLLCDACATRLRLARDFKRQVLLAEDRFLKYHGNEVDQVKIEYESPINCPIKTIQCSPQKKIYIKPKGVKETGTKQYSARKSKKITTDDVNRVDTAVDSEIFGDKNKTCYTLNASDVPTYDNSNGDSDSDTPISKMMEFYKKDEINNDVSVKAHRPSQNIKLISERKRIKLTCETVLQNTTACPFRHHKSWFQCFYCTTDFMTIDTLRQHLKNHKPEEVLSIKRFPRSLQIDITELQCTICDVNLTDVKNMIDHFSVVHNKVVYQECIADFKVNTSPYTCHLCMKQYHVFRTLTTHLNEHYANCICHVCGKSFLNSKRLKVHKRTHESGNFPCQKCGKILKTKTSKANHMETHSKRVIKCHICHKPMKHYNDRIKHMSEEHNVTHTFKCHICDRVYNIKHYLATHMRQTHGHKNKKCLECEMTFITNHGLKKHMLKHSGVKPFACTVCRKSFARSYTLKEHMRGHDEAKL